MGHGVVKFPQSPRLKPPVPVLVPVPVPVPESRERIYCLLLVSTWGRLMLKVKNIWLGSGFSFEILAVAIHRNTFLVLYYTLLPPSCCTSTSCSFELDLTTKSRESTFQSTCGVRRTAPHLHCFRHPCTPLGRCHRCRPRKPQRASPRAQRSSVRSRRSRRACSSKTRA